MIEFRILHLIFFSVGLHVKPLVYVKKKIVPVEEQFKYVSDESSSDSNDEDWNLTAKQKKKESDKRFSGNPGGECIAFGQENKEL